MEGNTTVKVYALPDELGGVWALASGEYSPGGRWVQVGEGESEDPQYGQAFLRFTEKPLIHPALMIPQYCVDEERLRERTEEELDEAVGALPEPEISTEIQALRMLVNNGTFKDAEIARMPSLLRQWRMGTVNHPQDYELNERIQHEGLAYRCIVAHGNHGEPEWEPGGAGNLFVALGTTAEDPDAIPEWKAPEGGHDAYSIGDRVRHNSVIWESRINGNDTVPGTDERWWVQVEAE